MTITESLKKLYEKASKDKLLRDALLDTINHENQVIEFCKIASEQGIEIAPFDLICEGEEAYATMRRSTNGGGENSPLLSGEDDYYELFIAQLSQLNWND